MLVQEPTDSGQIISEEGQRIKDALEKNKVLRKLNKDRLKPGEALVTFDGQNITYVQRQKQTPFKPLPQIMMKMLADAVNHHKIKTKIAEEVKSERQATEKSSSEALYSDIEDTLQVP